MEMAMGLGWAQWVFAFAGAVLIGFGKSGIKGLGPVIVTVMVLAFGGKPSTGMIMPLLVVGDIYAVIKYTKHTRWDLLVKMLPWMVVGVVLGAVVGKELPEHVFQKAMSGIILVSTAMMLISEVRKIQYVPKHWLFASILGSLAGFTSMVGNLAGTFSNLYFLSLKIPKNHFIGTVAWLYLVINLFKLPFHIFLWDTVNSETAIVSMVLVAPLFVGLMVGYRLVKRINDLWFRRFVIVMTAIGALVVFLR